MRMYITHTCADFESCFHQGERTIYRPSRSSPEGLWLYSFSLIKFLSHWVFLIESFNEAACALQIRVWTCTLFPVAGFSHWVF